MSISTPMRFQMRFEISNEISTPNEISAEIKLTCSQPQKYMCVRYSAENFTRQFKEFLPLRNRKSTITIYNVNN